uniref:Uncharacterized protein n=1 Tax=Rhizophora mucronata TaxID=61149 RepID=A0A2P2QGM8_RHIMU
MLKQACPWWLKTAFQSMMSLDLVEHQVGNQVSP